MQDPEVERRIDSTEADLPIRGYTTDRVSKAMSGMMISGSLYIRKQPLCTHRVISNVQQHSATDDTVDCPSSPALLLALIATENGDKRVDSYTVMEPKAETSHHRRAIGIRRTDH